MTRFLRVKDVVARTGLSEMTLWRRQKAGTFPRRVKLGPNAVGFVEEEIESWCAARVAERDQRAFRKATERLGALADVDRP
jgi:prophage regulatory protein